MVTWASKCKEGGEALLHHVYLGNLDPPSSYLHTFDKSSTLIVL